MKIIKPNAVLNMADITVNTVFSYGGTTWIRTKDGALQLESGTHFIVSSFGGGLSNVVYHPRAKLVLEPKE